MFCFGFSLYSVIASTKAQTTPSALCNKAFDLLCTEKLCYSFLSGRYVEALRWLQRRRRQCTNHQLQMLLT